MTFGVKSLTKLLQLKSKFKDVHIHRSDPMKTVQSKKLAPLEQTTSSPQQFLLQSQLQHQSQPNFKADFHPVPFSDNSIVQDLLAKVEKITKVSPSEKQEELPETVLDSEGNAIQLDLVFYNNLLNYYAKQNDYQRCIDIFRFIKKTFKADIVSYACLINVAIGQSDIHGAFKLYTDMKNNDITPNYIVFTNLIQGCIKNGQIERAWTVFTHLKTEVEKPDSQCYSLMISACARTQDAEKALDLWSEMIDYNIPASKITYNNLIRACGMRSDYYEEAFSCLQQMIADGHEPNIQTYRTLMEIASKNCDLERARIIWNDFACRIDPEASVSSASEGSVTLKPDNVVFSQLLRLYYELLSNVQESAPSPTSSVGSTENDASSVDPPLPNLVQVDMILRPSDRHAGISDLNQDIPSNLALPLLTSLEKGRDVLLTESENIWNLAIRLIQDEKAMEMSGELWVRKLSLLSLDTSRDGIEQSLLFLNNAGNYGVVPSLKAFKMILKQVCRSDHFEEYGPTFWSRFMDWDRELENATSSNTENTMTLVEKEEIRKKTNRTRQQMQQCFFIYAYGKLDANDLDGAISVLQDAVNFRYPYYLPPIYISNVSKILSEAQRFADLGHLDNLKRLKEICPPLDKDPLSAVHSVLKQKSVASKWWGWDAIGISEKEKMEMIRKHKKSTGKAMHQEMENRRRSHTHQDNKAKKPVVFRGFLK